jgi:hypothetical protein
MRKLRANATLPVGQSKLNLALSEFQQRIDEDANRAPTIIDHTRSVKLLLDQHDYARLFESHHFPYQVITEEQLTMRDFGDVPLAKMIAAFDGITFDFLAEIGLQQRHVKSEDDARALAALPDYSALKMARLQSDGVQWDSGIRQVLGIGEGTYWL